jgi:hypothetical protein
MNIKLEALNHKMAQSVYVVSLSIFQPGTSAILSRFEKHCSILLSTESLRLEHRKEIIVARLYFCRD